MRAGSHLSTLDFSHRDAFGSVVVTIVVSVAVLGVLGWLARRALDSAIAAHAPAADTDTAPRG